MKKTSTELFDLIKTLNKSEKKYFQQFAHRHTIKGRNIYYELFQAINKQDVYDETLIKKRFAGQKAHKNFAVIKKQLYEQLLMALHQYHQVHSIKEKIKRDLHLIRILLKKRLFQQCHKRVQRIEKDIRSYGLIEYEIELIDVKYQLATQEFFKNTSIEDLENYHKQLQKALQENENIGKIRQISHTIQAIHYKRINVETLQNQDFFQALTNVTTPNENLRFELEQQRGLATYYFMTGQPKEASETNEQLLKWFEINEKQLILFPEVYISIFNNYLIDNLRLRNFEALEQGLQKLELLQDKRPFKNIPDLTMRMANQRFMIELNWIISTGDFQRSNLIIPQLEIFLKKQETAIQKINRITFYYLVAYCYFALEQFGKALVYLNKILAVKDDIVNEIIEFTRLLNLLTHFELGHHTLVESLITNSRRWLKTRRDLYKTEMLVFSYLKKWLNTINRKEQRLIWEKLWEELELLKNETREQRVLNYFNVLAWVKMKKDNTTFVQAYTN